MSEKRILIPMVDYVELRGETSTLGNPQIMWYDEEIEKLQSIRKYAKLLKMPLTLGMFVPTDEGGNILEEPKDPDPNNFWNESALDSQVWHTHLYLRNKYQQAKQRVLFEVDGKIDTSEKGVIYFENYGVSLEVESGYWFFSGNHEGYPIDTIEHLISPEIDYYLTPSLIITYGI